jgi:hypothetical protein
VVDRSREACSGEGVLVSGIFGAAADPAVADIPNEELHRMLLDCSRRLFGA